MKKLTFLCYMGGKSYMLNEILNVIDYNCRTYIELFLGGGSVFFNKNPHKVEIINDIDDDLINLYVVLQTCKDDFLNEIKKYCFSEKQFLECRKKFENKCYKNEIERAVIYFVLLNFSYNGNGRNFGYGIKRNRSKIFFDKINQLDLYVKRLQNAQILNRDFRIILENLIKSKNKDVIIYADPPYYNLNYYKYKFSIQDHKDLAILLNKFEGKVILSYYNFENIKELYPPSKWYYFKYKKFKYSISKEKVYGEELLILNYKVKSNLFELK